MIAAGFACSTHTSRQAARQPIRRLERLVAVGDAAEHDGLPAASSSCANAARSSSAARSLTTILRSKSVPAPEAQVLVRRARVAVGAGVEAAAVGVHAPGEADVRAVVLRRGSGACGPRTPPASPRARPPGTRPRSSPRDWAGSRSAPAARPLSSNTEHSFSQATVLASRAISTPRTRSSSVSPPRDGRPHFETRPRFQRLAALPPYVLATVDELKSRLRAAGHDVYDFGLGNPDGASPRAAVERLIAEAQRPGNQRYMPSRGLPEARQAICDWYARRYGQTFDPDGEAVVTLGAKEGLAHLLLAIVGPGDCVLSPDPCYPDSPLRRHHRGRRAGAGRDRPGTRRLRGDRRGARARAAQAQGADRQLPAQPDQRGRRPGASSRRSSRWREARDRCG